MPVVQAPDNRKHDLAQHIVQAPSDHHDDDPNGHHPNQQIGARKFSEPGATDRIQRRNQHNMNGGNMQNIGNFDYELAYFSNQAQYNQNKSAVKDMNQLNFDEDDQPQREVAMVDNQI
jgi:hypothetical protein